MTPTEAAGTKKTTRPVTPILVDSEQAEIIRAPAQAGTHLARRGLQHHRLVQGQSLPADPRTGE